MTRHYIGIDPGLHGAVTVLRVIPGGRPEVAWSVDLPTRPVLRHAKSDSKARRHDLPALAALLNSLTVWDPVRLVIEDVQGRGNQVGGHQLSYCVGLLHMGCQMAGLFAELVTPTRWKSELRVPSDKAGAYRAAMNKIEAADASWCTGPQGGVLDGRAEAGLIAYWGWNTLRGGSKST